MADKAPTARGILAVFPFLVAGSLPASVMRDMRARGHDVTVARYLAKAQGYTMDPFADFAEENRLIDLSNAIGPKGTDLLEEIIAERGIGLVLQIGAARAYPQLARIKERRPDLRMVDTLYNNGPHFHMFALYGGCFDGVLVESQEMVRLLQGGPHGAAVRQVESGVDTACFIPAGRAVEPPRPELVLGYIGRMSPEKNPLGFVALAEQLYARHPWVRFAMFGEGVMADAVKTRIAGSPAKTAICFAGYAEHPTAALAEIDVLVVPSLLDGRPAAIMEANACGVPVIGSPVGGIPELVEEGRNGFLAEPRAVARVADLVKEWRYNPAGFVALRDSARQVAVARFDRRRMMNSYEATYLAFLAQPARPVAVMS